MAEPIVVYIEVDVSVRNAESDSHATISGHSEIKLRLPHRAAYRIEGEVLKIAYNDALQEFNRVFVALEAAQESKDGADTDPDAETEA